MKKEIAEKWVTELRSDKRSQGKQYLHANDKYCCLGVLCEVAVESGLELDVTTSDDNGPYADPGVVTYYGNNASVLPYEVQGFVGAKTCDPSPETGDYAGTSMASLNDRSGLTFAQIADIVEAHWSEL